MIGWLRKPKPLGQQGEDAAAKFLRQNGMRILGRNVRLGRYEIDIIAQEGDTVAFVEVKTRRPEVIVDGERSVNETKRRHIRRAARMFIDQQDDDNMYYRFDVVAVLLPERGQPTIVHHRDAFMGS